MIAAARDAAIHDEIVARPLTATTPRSRRADATSAAASASGWRSPARWSPVPSLLILDEATAALDAVTELRIDDALAPPRLLLPDRRPPPEHHPRLRKDRRARPAGACRAGGRPRRPDRRRRRPLPGPGACFLSAEMLRRHAIAASLAGFRGEPVATAANRPVRLDDPERASGWSSAAPSTCSWFASRDGMAEAPFHHVRRLEAGRLAFGADGGRRGAARGQGAAGHRPAPDRRRRPRSPQRTPVPATLRSARSPSHADHWIGGIVAAIAARDRGSTASAGRCLLEGVLER